MAATPSREVTVSEVAGVSFGFYTPDEIKKLSVKKITSPVVFDNLKNPVPGGLYDPALGPYDSQGGSCATCGNKYHQCPGHFGHIELQLPVYNPLVFRTLLKLLRASCRHCYRLRKTEHEVARIVQKLDLLAEGRVATAGALPTGQPSTGALDILQDSAAAIKTEGGSAVKGEHGWKDEEDLGDWGKDPATVPEQATSKKGRRTLPKVEMELDVPVLASGPGATCGASQGACTAATRAAEAECVKELFSKLSSKCPFCGAASPKYKKEGSCSIFVQALSQKELKSNQQRGIVLDSAALGHPQDRTEGDAAEDMDVDGSDAATPSGASYLTPTEAQQILKSIWHKNAAVLSRVYRVTDPCGIGEVARLATRGKVGGKKAAQARALWLNAYNMFFLSVVLVPPNRSRPPSRMGDLLYENAQNVALVQVLTANLDLGMAEERERAPAGGGGQAAEGGGPPLHLRYTMKAWLRLQEAVNCFIDTSSAENPPKASQGIRQLLEKKEGLFRKNMMGKRVNFACRSVISPDPFLDSGEIGVPPYFAIRLSVPERVTPWNVEEMRELVVRGAHQHPGAVAVEDEYGRLLSLDKLSLQRREAVAKQLLSRQAVEGGRKGVSSPSAAGPGLPQASTCKTVYRHLRDGDIMLTNRQPTLHKPGMMAHRARVLAGERTIRMHYANCNTFNADFDGDEINLHLPQELVARAEGYDIVQAEHQYIVPTSGNPVRGLIQDHVVAGVLLTKMDTFLTRAEYEQLVYLACAPTRRQDVMASSPPLLPPTILKPHRLWTGKQVISSVLAHWARGQAPLTLTAPTKIKGEYWGSAPEEKTLLVYKGELLQGTLDKATYGTHGLVHAVQEVYGDKVAADVTSSLSRLLTLYLQQRGFTCGMADLLLKPAAEATRARLLARAELDALRASAEFVGHSLPPSLQSGDGSNEPELLVEEQKKVRKLLGERYRAHAKAGAAHDAKAVGPMHALSSEVVKVCLPDGQQKPFPANCLSLMTVSGAKGSNVNFSQISCLLGQQELEGRRVPRMASGKTLPSFPAYDPGARAGGFISDRFLSGLRPQEYYFHCMAGREGLVDTTVKTSRSGYLQRCLIKSLEPLSVQYDGTVRDGTDGSVVQFAYGEDGVDVTSAAYLNNLSFLADNAEGEAARLDLPAAMQAPALLSLEQRARRALQKRQKLRAKGAHKESVARKLAGLEPVSALFPASVRGVTSEAFADRVADYVRTNPDGILRPAPSSRKGNQGTSAWSPRTAEGFQDLMDFKFMRSLAEPGEAVGVIAAQSVGEPSTQMTLNTFHMAGRGEANVTMGIPRLREIFMTASSKIATPSMSLPLRDHLPEAAASQLAARLRRIRLAEVVEGMLLKETPVVESAASLTGFGRYYELQVNFSHPSDIPADAQITFSDIAKCFRENFTRRLMAAVKAAFSAKKARSVGEEAAAVGQPRAAEAPRQRPISPEEAEGEEDGGRPKRASPKDDVNEDEEENEDYREGKLRFAGGRGEAATYDEGDQEDRHLAARLQAQSLAAQDQDLDAPDDENSRGKRQRSSLGLPADDADVEEGEEDEDMQSEDEAEQNVTGPDAKVPGITDLRVKVHKAIASGTLSFVADLDAPQLLLLEMAERTSVNTMLRYTPGVEKCYVVAAKRAGEPTTVQTEGVNLEVLWEHDDLVDTTRVSTNDVAATLRTLGVEAARTTIVREVVGLFDAYGIAVNSRHLNLIADFMTQQGGYRPCNRLGIENTVSPFLKISFETAAHFLTEATLQGSHDDLASPASRIVVGRPVKLGTGCFDLLQEIRLPDIRERA